MTHHTRKFIDNSGTSLLHSSRKIADDVLSSLNSSILAVFNNRAISGSAAETLRVLAAWNPQNDFDRLARSLLLLSSYKAEQAAPGACYAFLKFVSGLKIFDSKPRKMIESDLLPLVSVVKDPTIKSLILDAIQQSGPTGNVSVFLGGITHVSVDESASFSVIMSPSFRNAKTLTSRKIVVYDGVIESVGQINAFLEECFQEKSRVVLLARAFASEVASTIYLNNQRGNFDIVPVSPEVSADGELTILDVSMITGYEDTSKISLKLAGQECNVIVEGNCLKINLQNLHSRNELLHRLRNEMSQFNDSEITQLLGQRIARISSRRVSVCIGSEFGDTQEIAKEKFDYGMRCYLSARRRGVVEFGDSVLPGDTLKVAKETYESFVKLLRNTGGSLVIDKKVAVAKRRNCK